MTRFRRAAALLSVAAALASYTSLPCRAQGLSSYTITTVAGNGTAGFSGDGSAATAAQLTSPAGVAMDGSGSLYITDQLNHRVRKVNGGTISTVAGTGAVGFAGDNGQATSAQVNSPLNITFDTAGNYYLTDATSNIIRKVTSAGVISTFAGNAAYGAQGSAGDGGKATDALLRQPTGVAADAAGNVYISDTGNDRIRMVKTDGTITTVVGDGLPGFIGDGGPATSARLRGPRGVAVDAAGNLYISDSGNHRIRKVTKDGTITTVAGNGVGAFAGDLGRAIDASLNGPRGLAVDAAGNIYVADYFNNRVRKVTTTGAIVTVAGQKSFGYWGDGGPATDAGLFFPSDVTLDASGNVYLADSQNNVVRMLTPVPESLTGPAILPGGVSVLADFGGGATIAPGSYIEILGSNLAGSTRAWKNADFKDSVAPTILGGTTVTIGGQAAFLSLVAPDRIQALVPVGVASGSQSLVVTTLNGASTPYAVTVAAMQPALLAPLSFNIGGKQYASAILPDGVTYAAPAGAIPDTASRPAHPGETVTLYGTGFGPVTPDIPVGQKAPDDNSLTTPFAISFGDVPATVSYAGLAQGQTGIYQFNVVVPDNAQAGAAPLTFKLGDASGTQVLYIEVGP